MIITVSGVLCVFQRWKDGGGEAHPEKTFHPFKEHQEGGEGSSVSATQQGKLEILVAEWSPTAETKSSAANHFVLRQLDHPNLCKFIGGSIEVPYISIITEHCPKGSLSDVLLNEDIPINWGFRQEEGADMTNFATFRSPQQFRIYRRDGVTLNMR